MRVLSLAAWLLCLSASPLCLAQAQQQTAPHEPGTGSEAVTPASKALPTVQTPDVRIDSAPHTEIDASVDSPAESGVASSGMDLGGAATFSLGQDIVPATPVGMLSRSVPGNPRMVYYALPHVSGDQIASEDSTIIASRQADLVKAAAFHGFDLKQSGWLYQQGICAPMQPNAEHITGIAPGDNGQGFILLHFVRHDDSGKVYSFAAIIPRQPGLPVRVVSGFHRSVENGFDFLSSKTSGGVVNEALPPETLYKNMQPTQDWIATSACIAEIGDAYPHIPNEPYLSEAITTAPPPQIRLMLDGERRVIFTDRIDDSHYVVWNEHISRQGKMLDAQHDQVRIIPRPITNPPVPQPRLLSNLKQPRVKIAPEPPSPIAGTRQ